MPALDEAAFAAEEFFRHGEQMVSTAKAEGLATVFRTGDVLFRHERIPNGIGHGLRRTDTHHLAAAGAVARFDNDIAIPCAELHQLVFARYPGMGNIAKVLPELHAHEQFVAALHA